MSRRNTIARAATSNKPETINVQPAPKKSNRHHHEHAKTTSPSSFVIGRGRPPGCRFVHNHPVSAVMVQVQAKQIKRESENQPNTSRAKRTQQSNPCTRPLCLLHCSRFHDACFCSSVPRHNSIAHTTTENKRETDNVQSAPTKPNPHHQEHAKIPPVRHRSSSSINAPFRPSSSRVGRHRASSSQGNQTRIRK